MAAQFQFLILPTNSKPHPAKIVPSDALHFALNGKDLDRFFLSLSPKR